MHCVSRGVIACVLLLVGSISFAGYVQPSYIDGGQSVSGRYTVTAKLLESGKRGHGPHKWEFTWTDTRENKSQTFVPQELTGGQIYGHIYVAPDGETFALWNHVVLWWEGKSHDHAHELLAKKEEVPAEQWRNQPAFSHRLVIYRKDGTILKSFAIADFLQEDEWETVMQVFNRVHWIKEYDGMNPKKTPRGGYAVHRISPDYTILEFLATTSRAGRRDPPREVRVDLTTGRVFGGEEKLTDELKIPVRPFLGDATLGGSGNEWKEGYFPSLDPLRVPATIKVSTGE